MVQDHESDRAKALYLGSYATSILYTQITLMIWSAIGKQMSVACGVAASPRRSQQRAVKVSGQRSDRHWRTLSAALYACALAVVDNSVTHVFVFDFFRQLLIWVHYTETVAVKSWPCRSLKQGYSQGVDSTRCEPYLEDDTFFFRRN